MIRKLILALGLVAAAGAPALANDTMAELKTGGLIFVRNDVVAIEREDLFISLDQVRVSYVFKNGSEADVDGIVAFPMPDIEGNPYENVAVPDFQSDNFLGFEVEVDGRAMQPQLQQRALAADLDVTDELEKAGVPLNPYSDAAREAVQKLPLATKDDWVARGMLFLDRYDAGKGWVEDYVPIWRLKSTYWWRMNFPAGMPVKVEHRYQPSVGGTVAVTFLQDGQPVPDIHAEYERKYCIDQAFDRAVQRALDRQPRRAAAVLRELDLLCADDRCQLGDDDPRIPPDDRQGKPAQSRQLLRDGREQDRPDDVRDDGAGFLSDPRPRHIVPAPDGRKLKVTLVFGVAQNGVIGRAGGLPWRLSTDMKRFKATTMGKPVIMGRKTWESLPRQPLPGRRNIVVTRNPGYRAEGADVAASLDEALEIAQQDVGEAGEACVIGGAQLYRDALDKADRLDITHVLADVDGDVELPPIDPAIWEAISSEEFPKGERDDYATRYVVYERRKKAG